MPQPLGGAIIRQVGQNKGRAEGGELKKESVAEDRVLKFPTLGLLRLTTVVSSASVCSHTSPSLELTSVKASPECMELKQFIYQCACFLF